jgi:hypothetical protein
MSEEPTSSGPISEEQKEEFLTLIREGWLRPKAAREVGTTGTKFRGLAKRDPEFKRLYDEAVEIGEPAWHENLREEYRRRAFLNSDKLLHNLALITLPEFAPMMETRFRVGNLDGEAFRLAAAEHIDMTKLSDTEIEELREILLKASKDTQEDQQEETGGEITRLPLRALPPAAEG